MSACDRWRHIFANSSGWSFQSNLAFWSACDLRAVEERNEIMNYRSI
jgi:hypothetical protein